MAMQPSGWGWSQGRAGREKRKIKHIKIVPMIPLMLFVTDSIRGIITGVAFPGILVTKR